MNKAEERALEAFPTHCDASEEWIQAHLKSICKDYINGYIQAIKDVYAEVERLNKRNEDARAERKNSEPLYYDGKSDGFNGIFCFLDDILES